MIEPNDDIRQYGITLDKAIILLDDAAHGTLIFNIEFKAACLWGRECLLEIKRDRIKQPGGHDVTSR